MDEFENKGLEDKDKYEEPGDSHLEVEENFNSDIEGIPYKEVEELFSERNDDNLNDLVLHNDMAKDQRIETKEIEETGFILRDSENKNNYPEIDEIIETKPKEKPKNSFKRVLAIVAVASIFGGATIGASYAIVSPLAKKYFGNSNEYANDFAFDKTDNRFVEYQSRMDALMSKIEDGKEVSYADIVKKVKPSVVCITVQKEASFFNVTGESPGAGSGIIFNEDAENVYIVTNHHVVSGANHVEVTVAESKPVKAKPIGSESKSDLAVISISKADLKSVGIEEVTVATFGNSDDLDVGDTVFAIGNAMGAGNTATRGIVSAQDKQIVVEDKELNVIQTDAAINPGNSGGPLIDVYGDVIGINTAKFSSKYKSDVEGMGYSISSNIAEPIITRLMNGEEKAFLGVSPGELTKDIMDMYNIPSMGVFIEQVIEGSSAEKAGILRHDIITSFNNVPILNFDILSEEVGKCKVGDTIPIKLLRNGREKIEVTVTLTKNMDGSF